MTEKFSQNDTQNAAEAGITLSDWEFEFQQRNEHPILMADFWCRALHQKFVQEMDLPVEPYDYLFTDSSKGYVKTAQKKITLEAVKKALGDSNTYSEYIHTQAMERVNELDITARFILEQMKGDLDGLSNQKLIELWKKFDDTFITLIPWYWIPYYPIELNILSDKVKDGLSHYKTDIEKFTDFNNAHVLSVSSAGALAFIDEQKSFFELVEIAAKTENFIQDSAFNEKAKVYLEKYSWMTTFVLLPIEPLSFSGLIEKIRKAITERSVETYLLLQQKKIANEEILRKIIDLVKDDTKLLSDIEQTKKIGWVLTWSVETSLHTLSDLQPFFKLIASRAGIPYSEWICVTSDEIRELLNGEKTSAQLDLAERTKGYLFVMENGEQKMIVGEQGKTLSEWVDKNLNKAEQNITEFKGQPACPGHVTGKVRVILIAKDAHLIKDGEILVCAMTSPDYVPAMKRSAAIVTDEGGLLCHAAIMSREFGKPCVIATKIGTRVLKDGDTVEVDAEKGIVRLV